MSAAERVGRYYDDAKVLISSGSLSKIMAEVKKLTVYLQKHQTESIPEGAKTKLYGAIETYYRHAKYDLKNEPLIECVSSLLGSYLQLPEGKLVSATNKKKVLQWIQELCIPSDCLASGPSCGPHAMLSSWSLESLNDDGTITLLSTADSEVWKEDYRPANLTEHMEAILRWQSEGTSLYIDLDERSNTIFGLREE